MGKGRLDNPVWYTLTDLTRHLALGQGAAGHYPRDVAVFDTNPGTSTVAPNGVITHQIAWSP